MNFYSAFNFLCHHSKGNFIHCLDIDVAKVNPQTLEIDDDKTKNTLVQVWLEIWPSYNVHDWDLDCGGSTFEEAIVKLAELVKKHYGE